MDTNQPVHISWLKLLVSVINELSCMKLIARAEQIGLTWPWHNKEGQVSIATT